MTALDPAVRSALNLMVARLIVPPSHQRIAAVIELVAWHTGVNRRDITGPSRARAFFRPRAAVCWLAVELKLGSTTVIGRAIGQRDHTTIIDAHRRGEDFRLRDPAFKRLTDRLLQHFRDLQED
ncbi:helix-turn-helix domain-containing protein [Sphingobium rhizovicinum]|uniref:Helix-turn-helix domain-containing protein n=1 Tax=Sphingobium rhizovicinum TaxID=432308 RepID=A0ABV7NK77_9SPHN